MSTATTYAWGLRGRLLDLAPDQLDRVADEIAALPADTGSADAREVRRVTRILNIRASARHRRWARHLAALSRRSR